MRNVALPMLASVLLMALPVGRLRGQEGDAPVLVATSQSPVATAYNNGRRMVRDSRDTRYLVYQDLAGGVPLVCFTRSSDGKVWSVPEVIAEGAFPSLAIDQRDRLFLVWQSPDASQIFFTFSTDGGASWRWPPETLNPVPLSGVWPARYPVVEAGATRVHFAWQEQVSGPAGAWQHILYGSLRLDSLEGSTPGWTGLSQPGIDAQFPALAYNLDFSQGSVHLVWYDSTQTGDQAICYRRLEEATGMWTPPLEQPPWDLSRGRAYSGYAHPAISVGGGEVVHVVWQHIRGFHSLLFLGMGELQERFDWEVSSSGEPMVCVDDVYLKHSALVWVDHDEVYYMQARDGAPISSDYIAISAVDGVPSRFPSVCYKHFRADSLDVVWTDGSEPPYRVFYRRVQKIHPGQAVQEPGTGIPARLVLLPSYPNPFNSSTLIRYELPSAARVHLAMYNALGVRLDVLADEWQAAGGHQVRWDGIDAAGRRLPSGVYLCRLTAGTAALERKLVLLR